MFGRRWLTISIVAIFALGSGISGGASSTRMLIAGRAVQGIGGGGIILMIELIVCDLVPLRDRGRFMGVIFALFSIGASMGPFIGGAIAQHATWRWIFYMNLPIAGVALVLHLLFLHVNYNRSHSALARLRRIDYIGNLLLVASVAAVLVALTYGGSIYPWQSWRVLVPLLLGFAGFFFFTLYESSRWCIEPVTPPRLFANRTSAAAFFLTFVHALYSFWVLYFLPVYFQAVLLARPERSGVLLLATVITLVPGGMVSGILLSKTGRYRVLHMAGFALMTLGTGLFILLDKHSSIAVVVVLQIVSGLGSGLSLTTLLPATQAALSEKDTASSTATWTFIRTFGTNWGVSIPSAIFNSRASELADRIDDPSIRVLVANGQAYSHASADFLRSLPQGTLDQVIEVFTESLKIVWIVATAITGLSFFVVFTEKEIKLRDKLDTEYGLENKNKTPQITPETAPEAGPVVVPEKATDQRQERSTDVLDGTSKVSSAGRQ